MRYGQEKEGIPAEGQGRHLKREECGVYVHCLLRGQFSFPVLSVYFLRTEGYHGPLRTLQGKPALCFIGHSVRPGSLFDVRMVPQQEDQPAGNEICRFPEGPGGILEGGDQHDRCREDAGERRLRRNVKGDPEDERPDILGRGVQRRSSPAISKNTDEVGHEIHLAHRRG